MSAPFPLILRMNNPSPPSRPRLRLCIWLSIFTESAPARNPSFCTMYSLSPSSSMITISPGTVGANNTSPGPRLARNVWKKNFSPVRSLRERAPRDPPSHLLSTSMVGYEATMAPDSALIVSPAASSTRTIGNSPGYKISLLIFLSPLINESQVTLTLQVSLISGMAPAMVQLRPWNEHCQTELVRPGAHRIVLRRDKSHRCFVRVGRAKEI